MGRAFVEGRVSKAEVSSPNNEHSGPQDGWLLTY
jgi:hypothetical protein